jgi:hypothetical protein
LPFFIELALLRKVMWVMPKTFLVTYRPLVATPQGVKAARLYGDAPFVDGSCRREPDLEGEYPTITCLCRKNKLVGRLRQDCRVIYMTVKGNYPGDTEPGWRFVSVLEPRERFNSHQEAAEWYQKTGRQVPGNLMINGSQPLPLDRTSGMACPDEDDCVDFSSLAEWNLRYAGRAQENPHVWITRCLFKDLENPKQMTESDARSVFRSDFPGTQNPPELSETAAARLLAWAGLNLDQE